MNGTNRKSPTGITGFPFVQFFPFVPYSRPDSSISLQSVKGVL